MKFLRPSQSIWTLLYDNISYHHIYKGDSSWNTSRPRNIEKSDEKFTSELVGQEEIVSSSLETLFRNLNSTRCASSFKSHPPPTTSRLVWPQFLSLKEQSQYCDLKVEFGLSCEIKAHFRKKSLPNLISKNILFAVFSDQNQIKICNQ